MPPHLSESLSRVATLTKRAQTWLGASCILGPAVSCLHQWTKIGAKGGDCCIIMANVPLQ